MMKALCLKLTPLIACCIFITGCKTVTVVPHAISCDASAELLARKCATPKPIADNATFATLVETSQADRQALRECAITVDTMRETINRCKQATDEFNKKIDATNSTK